MKILLLPIVAMAAAWLPTTVAAQAPGTYQLLAAGTTGQEKGYCSVGTVTLRSNKSISITTKNPLDRSPAPRYSGSIQGKSFSATAGNRKLVGRITYAGSKHAFGNYTAYVGSKVVGTGRISLTRK